MLGKLKSFARGESIERADARGVDVRETSPAHRGRSESRENSVGRSVSSPASIASDRHPDLRNDRKAKLQLLKQRGVKT